MPKIQIKNKPIISMISAISKNRGIGKNNKLLFDIPEDLKYFCTITSGHPVIMGERTYYSMGRPLPKRLNIVLSQNKELIIPGCIVCFNIDDAIRIASEKDKNEIFFIGGGMVYSQAIKFAGRLYLTIIDAEPEADTYFPDYSDFKKIVSREPHEYNGIKFEYRVLEK